MHRAALALGATSLFAIKLSHAFIHAHAECECVGVAAVGGDVVIVFPAERKRANGDGFLADVKVKEASHTSRFLVICERDLLETADANHLRVKLHFSFRSE